jgi:hypothetical protein
MEDKFRELKTGSVNCGGFLDTITFSTCSLDPCLRHKRSTWLVMQARFPSLVGELSCDIRVFSSLSFVSFCVHL